MNKAAIQRFAIWARTELIAQVSQRAYQYGITADGCGDDDAEAVGGRLLSGEEKQQRQQLIGQIRSKGYAQVMEEVAYTWFNRLIALRFMEVNNYLPSHIRVFSDASGAFRPEILSDALHLDLDGLDMKKVSDLIEKNQSEALYRYLLLTQCNALSGALPRMFEPMGSYTELLLPNNILRQDGVLGRMVTDIPEEDWTDQVQIIGWLYQYYNTELKDETFALLKKNVKITKERIPSATQLFTPDWIVRYMVENSLGRLWLEGHPDDELKAGWKYYLEEAEQEPDVQAQLEAIRAEYRALRPQDIKVIDPCMGSGHILVYAFDVLVQIYKKAGFSERDAAQSILENNLYGLDIDDRAAQLAYFAVMMKARQYDRRIFARNIQPHVYAIVESNNVRIPAKCHLGPEQDIAEKLVSELRDAKEYGNILNLSLSLGELTSLHKRLTEIEEMSNEGNLMDIMESGEIVDGLLPLLEMAKVMTTKYHAVITNPPYMGNNSFNAKLGSYIKSNYNDVKGDLFAVMMTKISQMVVQNGIYSMITQQSWMFLSSYEALRHRILDESIISLAHLGARAFDEIGGEMVSTTTFTIRKANISRYNGNYRRLVDYQSEKEKEEHYFDKKCSYNAKQESFEAIPGIPVAYWISENVSSAFKKGESITKYADTFQGIITGDNDKFLRQWFEVSSQKIPFYASKMDDVDLSSQYWIPYNKGGEFRKWYGVQDHVVYWRFGPDDKTRGKKGFSQFYLREYVAWSYTISNSIATRYYPCGFLWDVRGSGIMDKSDSLFYLEGLISSKIGITLFQVNNSTLSCQVENIIQLPIITDTEVKPVVDSIVKKNNALSKNEWDSFEISWDFEMHPLVRWSKALWDCTLIAANMDHFYHCKPQVKSTVELCYLLWQGECNERFTQLKANEEELNRIFIDIYGLQDELTSEVEDKDVTVRRADLGRDIRSLISYAVGCMFGRYSLDTPGLAYAGGDWQDGKYSAYLPDKDNIIPICDDEYFDDDITGRFVAWVEVVFGKDTLEENLKFIAGALGGKGTPREVIRSYFLNDFYADHLKIYQKRPIYWLFDSGKKNGFKALIYMHRYQSDLLARMRTDYVHEQQERYRTQLKHIGDAMDAASTPERVKLAKRQKKLQEQALELQKYEEKIHHLADQNIEIDLDDGVKHNYALFEDVLAKIK